MHKKYLRDIIISSVTLFTLLTGDRAWAMDDLPEKKCVAYKTAPTGYESAEDMTWLHGLNGKSYYPQSCPDCKKRRDIELRNANRNKTPKKKK